MGYKLFNASTNTSNIAVHKLNEAEIANHQNMYFVHFLIVGNFLKDVKL